MKLPTEFYKGNRAKCTNATIEIEDVTPTEEEQKALRKLIEEKSGYTIEEMRDIKRKNGAFEIDVDFLT